jgi:hypothetical protein
MSDAEAMLVTEIEREHRIIEDIYHLAKAAEDNRDEGLTVAALRSILSLACNRDSIDLDKFAAGDREGA